MRSSKENIEWIRRQLLSSWKSHLLNSALSCFCSCCFPAFQLCWSLRVVLFPLPPLKSLVLLLPLFILCEIISKVYNFNPSSLWVSKMYLICMLWFLHGYLFIFQMQHIWNTTHLSLWIHLCDFQGWMVLSFPCVSSLKGWSFSFFLGPMYLIHTKFCHFVPL